MDRLVAAAIALAGWALFFVLAFGWRSWLHYRRTGSTGFVGLSGKPLSAEWWGGALFAVALMATALSPVIELRSTSDGPPLRTSAVLFGLGLFAAGLAGTLWAQLTMGNSWRIGVDATEHTTLVSAGPFRWVRNPIFTAMTCGALGLALLVPTLLSWVGLATLLVALEIQVRLVEEPYLVGAHGAQYETYARRTGRFVPGLGRL